MSYIQYSLQKQTVFIRFNPDCNYMSELELYKELLNTFNREYEKRNDELSNLSIYYVGYKRYRQYTYFF